MTAFMLIGLICLVAGVLFLIRPGALIKLSEMFNRIVAVDSKTLKYRVSVGLIFVALGLFFLFMAYYFNSRGWL